MKITRTHLVTVSVAAMLIIAGCADQSIPDAEKISVEIVESNTSETASSSLSPQDSSSRSQINPEQNLTLTEYANERGEGTAGLSSAEQERVQNLVVGFYDEIAERNASDRRNLFLESAQRLCEYDQGFENSVNASRLEQGGQDTNKAIRRAHYAAQIVNEFDGDIPIRPLEEFRSNTGDVTKYAPLLGSYNQMSDAACHATQEETDQAIKKYQFSVLMFGVDATLISTGAFYQPAFAGTRFAANRASELGMYRLRYVCGNRCWALAMSEVHVALRGSMHTFTSNLARTAGEMGIETIDEDDLYAIAESFDTQVDNLISDAESLGSDALDTLPEDILQCDGTPEKEDEVSDGGIFNGEINTDKITDHGEEAIGRIKGEC